MEIVLTILISYLIGCFSPAYFLGRFIKKTDIRECGSGNAGTTNALRVFGKKIGILTFIIDISKGMLAVLLGQYIMGEEGKYLASLFVVFGHNWPVFLKFKGGKGIATSLGVLIILNWKLGFICLLVGVSIIIFTKYVSLGSLTASVTAPIVSFILLGTVYDYLFYTTLILAFLSIFRHRSNINRLIRGKENKLAARSVNKDR